MLYRKLDSGAFADVRRPKPLRHCGTVTNGTCITPLVAAACFCDTLLQRVCVTLCPGVPHNPL